MKDAIRRYLQHLDENLGGAKNTILAYRTDLKQFEKVVSSKENWPLSPSSLSRVHILSYVDWLNTQGYQPSTISRKMAAARSFIEYLYREEGVGEALAIDTLKPPPAPRPKPRILGESEIAALVQAPLRNQSPRGLRDSAILSLLYATGLRATEAVDCEIGHVDLERRRIFRPLRDGTSLPLGDAFEPMHNYLIRGRPYLLRTEKEPALFLNLRGEKLSRQGLWLVVKRWSQTVGLGKGVSPHTLRHSLVHHLLRKGKTRKEIQTLLGLTSPNAIRIHTT
jgi:integrase/recombinase XerD